MRRAALLQTSIELRPITLRDANAFVARHHRHNGPVRGWLFGSALYAADEMVGVVLAGRPNARQLQDGRTVEVSRVCTLGTPNAASMLYGSACRAAKALGYLRAVTYKLASEPGTSLLAAGFVKDADCPARSTWSTPGRLRNDHDLFGPTDRPTEAKERWVRWL